MKACSIHKQMDQTIRLYSLGFCPSSDQDHFSLSVEESIWRKAYNEIDEGGRIFLRIYNEDESKELIAPMGNIVYGKSIDHETHDDHHHVYAPLWLLDSVGFGGTGEILKCSILTNDAFPEATKITLRVVDSAMYSGDIKEELESALTKLGVIRKHTVLQIPVEALGGFPVEVFVSNLEPADTVLCEGDEVAVEFEEPVDHFEPPAVQRPPTPIPQLPPLLTNESIFPPFDSVESIQTGQFLAFQGTGHTLGGGGGHIPEWRRNLPVRPRRQEP